MHTLDAISKILEKMENKWLLHKYSLATNDITQYKKHVLRAVHQERAKTEIMERLSEKRAMVIFDFAMKFLPKKYREAQADFFGKKGKYLYIYNAACEVSEVCLCNTRDMLISNQKSVCLLETCLFPTQV